MQLRHIPNILSFSRIFLAPLFMVFMFKDIYLYKILSLLVFFLGSILDFLDGYIARKFDFTSDFGKYLDPIADKVLIISAFLTLNLFYPDLVKSWMILVIILRDIAVTLFRFYLMNNNLIMKTSIYAKVKTLVQIILIHIILIMHVYDFSSFVSFQNSIYYIMLFCTVYTVSTGLHYVKINFNHLK